MQSKFQKNPIIPIVVYYIFCLFKFRKNKKPFLLNAIGNDNFRDFL